MRNISKTLGMTLLVLLTMFASCNEDSDVSVYYDYGTFAISGFSIRSSLSNTGMDSVYFAIDLENGVIFNADSLQPGAKIDKLVTDIKYRSTPDSVIVVMEGGTTRKERLDYKKNPTDSIDYTGRVYILLKSGDKEKKYEVKLNVHKQYADSLYWDQAAVRSLPSRLPNPVAQKTIMGSSQTAYSLIQESDGTFTMSSSNDAFLSDITKRQVSFPFTPRIESLATAGGTLYLLDTDNNLWGTPNGGNWEKTGQTWDNIIGPYLETIVGLRTENGKHYFAQYPLLNLNETEIPENFPLSGYSNFVTLQNKWTLSPVAFFAGGLKADNTLSDATWAFDGREWIVLNNDQDLPAMERPSIIPYYYYRRSLTGESYNEFQVWMLVGGRKSDNSVNRLVYISYDNGVNWAQASARMQLPQAIPAMWSCDNIVVSDQKSANLSDNWAIKYQTNKQQRLPYEVDGDMIKWDCPYIYLIGGYGPDGKLYNTIWRGVLNRMTFVPII